MQNKVVIGIDLAGSENNRSGFAIIKEEFGQKDTKSRSIFSDVEILEEISRQKPEVVCFDAPITKKKENRKIDIQMQKYGALSLSLPGMQVLAKRAHALANKIKKLGVTVLEINPKATAEIIGIEPQSLSKSTHQADAILAAMTGFLYLEDKTKEIGDDDGKIIIPQPSRKKPLSQTPA